MHILYIESVVLLKNKVNAKKNKVNAKLILQINAKLTL